MKKPHANQTSATLIAAATRDILGMAHFVLVRDISIA